MRTFVVAVEVCDAADFRMCVVGRVPHARRNSESGLRGVKNSLSSRNVLPDKGTSDEY